MHGISVYKPESYIPGFIIVCSSRINIEVKMKDFIWKTRWSSKIMLINTGGPIEIYIKMKCLEGFINESGGNGNK